jgi:hypothetical protein
MNSALQGLSDGALVTIVVLLLIVGGFWMANRHRNDWEDPKQ